MSLRRITNYIKHKHSTPIAVHPSTDLRGAQNYDIMPILISDITQRFIFTVTVSVSRWHHVAPRSDANCPTGPTPHDVKYDQLINSYEFSVHCIRWYRKRNTFFTCLDRSGSILFGLKLLWNDEMSELIGDLRTLGSGLDHNAAAWSDCVIIEVHIG